MKREKVFFEKESQIREIASRTSCSIFVVPSDIDLGIRNAIFLRPDESKKSNIITVEQIRVFCAQTNHKEVNERFFIIAPAEAMNEAAQNAFLKTFEEPKPHCHFILLTEQPLLLLPTILSRAQVFYQKKSGVLDLAPAGDERIMKLAKGLISAKPTDLPKLAEEISKDKKSPRLLAQSVASCAIEILYKSYFKTKNPKFLIKVPNFIKLYENLKGNCHIKLHLVADLL